MSHKSVSETSVSSPGLVQSEFVGKWLSGSQRKTSYALRMNAETLVRECGLNSTGFLTLTVGDYFCRVHGKQIPETQNYCPCCVEKRHFRRMKFVGVDDAKESSRRMNNLLKWLKTIFEKGIVVTERHVSKAIHFHLLAGLIGSPDIRTGISHDELRRRNYRSASAALRAVWRQLRDVLPRYGFGRHELLPIRKTGEAVAAYIAKYIEKNVCNRTAADKHKKLVRYFGWNKCQLKPNEFEWNGVRAQAWRAKARAVCELVGVELPDRQFEPVDHVKRACCSSAGAIRPKMLDGSLASEMIGPRWAFHVSGLVEKVSPESVPFMVWDYLTVQICKNEMLRACENRREITRTADRFRMFREANWEIRGLEFPGPVQGPEYPGRTKFDDERARLAAMLSTKAAREFAENRKFLELN